MFLTPKETLIDNKTSEMQVCAIRTDNDLR